MTLYRCPECGKTLERNSRKWKIRSYCSSAQVFTKIRRKLVQVRTDA